MSIIPLQLPLIFLYSVCVKRFLYGNNIAMKKLLTLGVLVAGVALFAGCMNKPAVEDETTTPTVEEVTPAVEEATGTVEDTTTPTEVPTPTAE